jgi:hypothetical protein
LEEQNRLKEANKRRAEQEMKQKKRDALMDIRGTEDEPLYILITRYIDTRFVELNDSIELI